MAAHACAPAGTAGRGCGGLGVLANAKKRSGFRFATTVCLGGVSWGGSSGDREPGLFDIVEGSRHATRAGAPCRFGAASSGSRSFRGRACGLRRSLRCGFRVVFRGGSRSASGRGRAQIRFRSARALPRGRAGWSWRVEQAS